MVRVLLPKAQTAARPVPPADPSVPASAVAIPAALADFATQAPRERAMRSRGRAFPDLVAGFAGDYTTAPDVVARPRDAAEVARVLEVCEASGWAVVPFGGGTSVVGGVDAGLARRGGFWSQASASERGGVVTLDLGGLAGVREVDATSRL